MTERFDPSRACTGPLRVGVARDALFAFVLVCALLSSGTAEAAGPQVGAPAGILVDAESGQILWQKASHERRPVASTTKVLTGILVIEHANLSDTVEATQEAADAGGAEIYLEPGEKRTVDELLYATMLKSANDAAAALAVHVGGSVKGFTDLMNRKAAALGAKDSHFSSPNGLHKPDHYSSAHDLALIARYAMKNELFRQVVATRRRVIPWPGRPYARLLKNHNRLSERYPYAVGIKTGYTRQAGQCLVSAAKKGNRELIAVLLGSPSADALYRDSAALLEYGFNDFRSTQMVRRGQVVAKVRREGALVPLVAGKDLAGLVRKVGTWETKVVAAPSGGLSGVLKTGQKVGEALVFSGGGTVGSVPLVVGKLPKEYADSLEPPGAFSRAAGWVRGLLGF